MKYVTSIAFLLAVGLFAAVQPSCYYDNEVDLYGTACDTTGVRYSAEITALMANNCNSCHSQAGGTEPFLDTYQGLKAIADPNGKLVGRTNNAASPMPPTQLLPDCDRNKIKAWVNAGAPEN